MPAPTRRAIRDMPVLLGSLPDDAGVVAARGVRTGPRNAFDVEKRRSFIALARVLLMGGFVEAIMRNITMSRTGAMWLAGALALVGVARCSGSAESAAGGDSLAANRAAGEDPNQGPPPSQELQESDIYRREGDRMYILNRFRGLIVADMGNLDQPVMRGRLPLPAEPREMWFSGTSAFIITASKAPYGWGWGWNSSGGVDVDTWATYAGSALVVADVTDAANPRLSAMTQLGGNCFDGRLRGHLLYLACTGSEDWTTPDSAPASYVYALDVSDPAHPVVTSKVEVPVGGNQHHLAVGADRFFLISGTAWSQTDSTITIFDLDDQNAAVTRRGTLLAPGEVVDRFAVDEYQGVLRVASGSVHGNGDLNITTYDLADPDAPTQLGRTTLHVDEEVKSARFDGKRGYAVTFKRVDPLFIFDMGNPREPRMMSELEMSGWLDFMVPMGDRLLAMGHEITEERQGRWGWTIQKRTLAVSLIDVTGEPRLLSRIPLDGQWGTVPAERDDFNKVFRVFKDEGLVVFPYRTFEESGWSRNAGMLLIDWVNDTLSLRADLQGIGLVERGILWDSRSLVTLSVQVLQAFDIGDRAAPRVRGRLELASQTADFVTLENGTIVEVAGDIYGGRARLRAWPVGSTDEKALSDVELDAPFGYAVADGNRVYFADARREHSGWEEADAPAPEPTTVTVVDYADPANPSVVSSLTLPDEVTTAQVSGWYSYGPDKPVTLAAPGVLALYRGNRYTAAGCSHSAQPATVVIVDLRDPSHPREAGRKELKSYYGQTFQGGNGRVHVAGYGGVETLDVSNPGNIGLGDVQRPGMNIVAMDAHEGTAIAVSNESNRDRSETFLLLLRFDGVNWEEKSRISRGNGYLGYARGVLTADRVIMADYQALVSVARNGDTLGEATSQAMPSNVVEVLAVQDGAVVCRGASTVDVFGMSGNVMLPRMSFPVVGLGGAYLDQGGVTYVATGYHGLVRRPHQQ